MTATEPASPEPGRRQGGDAGVGADGDRDGDGLGDRDRAGEPNGSPARLRERGATHGLFAATLLTTLALDQLTKALVRGWLAAGERWPAADAPVARFFTFTHVHNTGMAFGLGQGRSEVFALVASVVVLGLMVYQSRLPRHALWLRLALGLQAGGAIGNLVDRLRQGHVTDFLDFQVWPVFNVADSAIFVGVAILAWHLWRADDDVGPPESTEDEVEEWHFDQGDPKGWGQRVDSGWGSRPRSR